MLKYELEFNLDIIEKELKKMINQIYKLLPNREENLDWESPLGTIIEEFAGMQRLFIDQQDIFLPLIAKLEGLYTLDQESDFFAYRRTIFECINLVNVLKDNICLP